MVNGELFGFSGFPGWPLGGWLDSGTRRLDLKAGLNMFLEWDPYLVVSPKTPCDEVFSDAIVRPMRHAMLACGKFNSCLESERPLRMGPRDL